MPLLRRFYFFIVTAIIAGLIEFCILLFLFKEDFNKSLITSLVGGVGAGIGILLAVHFKKKKAVRY